MHRAIFIDKDRCVGCYSCIVACKLEHSLPPHPVAPPLGNPEGSELVRVYQVGPEILDDGVDQYFQPIPCLHCMDAPCIKACPRSALYKDIETGITLIDEDKCIGCKFCLWVCPYGSPQFIMVKCTSVTSVFIELVRADKKEDKPPAKQLVRPGQYT